MLEDGEYGFPAGGEVLYLALEEVADERFHLYRRKHFAHLDVVAAGQDECQLVVQGIGMSAVLLLDGLHHLLHDSYRIALPGGCAHDGERTSAKG